MLGHLIRKEILDQLLSKRFIILSSIAAVTIWLCLYNGYGYYQDCVKDYHLAQAMTDEVYDLYAYRYSFEELGRIGFKEHKPPTSMSIFIRGLEPILGRSISNSWGSDKLIGSPVEAEPVLGVFPTLDLGLVVQVILGLFVLMLTYDAVCGEKEAGTLSLTFSFRVSRHQFLLGKFLGVSIPVLAAFGLPLLLGIAVIAGMPDVKITSDEWVRLLSILATIVLYLSTLMGAGLLASCVSQRSATSFVLLLFFWVASVVVVPRTGFIAAEAIRPIPKLREQANMRRSTWGSINRANISLREWEEKNPNWQDTPEGQEGFAIQYWKINEENRAIRKIVGDQFDEWFGNRYDARLNLALTLSRFSPAFGFHNASIRLAGTGIDRHRRFESAFKRDYMKVYRNWFNTSRELDVLKERHPQKYGDPIRDFSNMPRLTYRETWPMAEVQNSLIDVALLAGWGLAFFTGAYVAMLRYDPR